MKRALLACCGAAALLVATLATVTPARAHLGAVSYSTIIVNDLTVTYILKFAAHQIPDLEADVGEITPERVLELEPSILEWLREAIVLDRGADRCKPELMRTVGPDEEDDLSVALRFACTEDRGTLRVQFTAFTNIARSQNIASIEIDGRKLGYVFTAEHPVMNYRSASARTPESVGNAATSIPLGFREFFELGVEHIWTGYDHLLFLIALLLPGGTFARLVTIVTAFTIAHSATLGLAAFDLVRLPPAPVEIAIALTIIWAASLSLREMAHDRRRGSTFFLGLIHGFGFAGVLATAGLSRENIVVPLLAFNAGVEVGQIVVVACVIPLIALINRSRYNAQIRTATAWLIVAAGVFWASERIAGLLTG